MKQNTRRMMASALALAALFTTGCHVQIVPGPPIGTNPPVTAQQKTGTVQVAFQQPAAYQPLATRDDVHHVTLTLQPERGKIQERKLDAGSFGNVEFTKVATGKAQLSVVAYDADNQVIGKGYNSAYVGPQQIAFMHVAVKLHAGDDSGTVNALITFEEEMSEEEAFYNGDHNHDGHLSLGEYRQVHHQLGWPIMTPGHTTEPAQPQHQVDPVPSARQVLRTPIAQPMPACIPPQPQDTISQAFHQKDWDGNGLLNLDEFLGRIYAVPVPHREPATDFTDTRPVAER